MTNPYPHWAGAIRDVADFPRPGIRFKDITPLLADADGFRAAVAAMADPWRAAGVQAVLGVEARGFILGAALALELGAGFVPVRKLGKLPGETISVEYALEYGTNTLEIHKDAIGAGQRVLVVDDLLATGGTVLGTIELIRQLKAEIVGLSFLVELLFLKGRDRLSEYDIHSIVQY